MTNLAEILKKDPLYPVTPCQYCTNPVGYGDHERYCSQNPDNLARSCGYGATIGNGGCSKPGNIISEGDWICRDHADWRNAKSNLRSRKSSIEYTREQIKLLHDKIHSLHCSLPEMYKNLEKSEENLKMVTFKMRLNGTKEG